ncbi:Transposon Ty3-G Gag-Pol polyprotein [Arachis hypogaea]|nr:Transposon Ty3-G Gag-Pol polyprotein [Arachis hypogaea]
MTFSFDDCQNGMAEEDTPFVMSASWNGDNFIKPDDSVVLSITIKTGSQKKTVLFEFIVLKDSQTYNIILGRKTINDLTAAIFIKFLIMKYQVEVETIETIHGDRQVAVEYNNASLVLQKWSCNMARIFLADLDTWQDDPPRLEPKEYLEKLQIEHYTEEVTYINRNLPFDLKRRLIELLKENKDLFTFTPVDMPKIDPTVISHRLAMDPKAKPIIQRRKKMSLD